MVNPLHVGDYGTILSLTIKDQNDAVVNLDSSSGNIVYIMKPNNVIMTRDGFTQDATNGIITYTIQSGELDIPGIYSLQAKVITPSGNFSSNCSEFRVDRNLI